MLQNKEARMTLANHKLWLLGICAFIALWIMLTERALGAQPWLDELRDTLVTYQGFYPEGNWSPYLDKLRVVQEGIDQANPSLIATAMEEFLTMLRVQAYGINGIAAHALYWIALSLQPHDPAFAIGTESVGKPV